jgi:hypothetical protein
MGPKITLSGSHIHDSHGFELIEGADQVWQQERRQSALRNGRCKVLIRMVMAVETIGAQGSLLPSINPRFEVRHSTRR